VCVVAKINVILYIKQVFYHRIDLKVMNLRKEISIGCRIMKARLLNKRIPTFIELYEEDNVVRTKRWDVMVIVLTLIATLIAIQGCLNSKSDDSGSSVNPTSTILMEDLKNANAVMWIGPHADDELYTGGTLGYATRDLGKKLTIISFNNNPAFYPLNNQSAEFIGNADYIYLLEENEFISAMTACEDCPLNAIQDCAEALIKAGLKDKLIQVIKNRRPDLIFTFEPTNGYRGSCQHAASAVVAEKAIEEAGINIKHYYILNRDPVFSSYLGENTPLDPEPVSDVIELDEKMWGYRMKIFSIYGQIPQYSELLTIANSPEVQSQLLHKEFFKKVTENSVVFHKKDYNKLSLRAIAKQSQTL